MGVFRNVTNLGAVVTLFGGDWLLWIFITKVWSVHYIIIVMFINGVCYRGSSKKSRRGSPSGGSPSPIELTHGVSPFGGGPSEECWHLDLNDNKQLHRGEIFQISVQDPYLDIVNF